MTTGSDRPLRVLGFGSYDAAAHPRIGVLLAGLRARGHEVVEVNRPLGLTTAARVAILGQPWRLPVLAARIAQSWLHLVPAARRALQDGPPDVVLVGYLGHFDVLLARRLSPRVPVVLDQLIFASDTARDRGAGGIVQRLLRRLDLAAVRASDLVVVDTEEHLALIPDELRGRGVVVAVGAPRSWFGERPPVAHDGPLSAVFFGLYTPLQGAPVIGRALALLADEPQVTVTMIGGGQDLVETRQLAAANPRVQWRDWVPAAELPALVAAHDVCLGIFADNPKGLRVVPNKVFQGAAAGCAVLTSASPPQRRALGEAAVYVPPGDPDALAAALRELAGDPARVRELRRRAADLADEQFTPERVVEPLLARLPGSSARLR